MQSDTVPTDDSDTPPPVEGSSELEVIETGAEPFIELSIDEAASKEVTVTATATDTGQIGDESFERITSRSYDLTTDIVIDNDDIVATIVPVITAAEPSIPIESTDEFGPWTWSIAANGERLDVNGPTINDARRQTLLQQVTAPELFAVVPDSAIGAGATWRYQTDPQTGVSTEAELVGFDDLTIQILYSSELVTDEGRLEFSGSSGMSGVG